MSVSFDGAVSSSSVQNQAQVAVFRKSLEAQGQGALKLINAMERTATSEPSKGDPPHVGRNLNVVA
ncbi:MAG: YjfB family protein [Magnetococcales bacterium]|nr:YjfB family protein [Magnetococcales bacterium]